MRNLAGSSPVTSTNNGDYPSGYGAVLIKRLRMVRLHHLRPDVFITSPYLTKVVRIDPIPPGYRSQPFIFVVVNISDYRYIGG